MSIQTDKPTNQPTKQKQKQAQGFTGKHPPNQGGHVNHVNCQPCQPITLKDGPRGP